MNFWIKTEDELPNYTCHASGVKMVSVIVCTQGGTVCEGLFVDGRWEVMGIECSVTHWMPLPNRPVEK